MIEKVNCPVCGGNQAVEIWSHASGVADGVCLICGHAYLIRQKSDKEIIAGYQDFKQEYPEAYLADTKNDLFERARLRHEFLARNMQKTVSINSVLEVGCAYGYFLSLFTPKTIRAGIEPSAALTFFCSYHVIEHVKDPSHLLAFARRMLKPNGYICLAAPNLFHLSP
ncbi:MAG: methyltransferase domain-containing protein, partial [Dissulfurimicrobium sp.]|uniref:methyltransferase domain-containing protein n=2 Tax=Dissulfurimicrobium sp. TaxID=2022436 RepID=UPI00404940FD